MFWRLGSIAVAGLLVAAAAAPALAHHSFAAEFDADKMAELKGEITQVWFNNPHVRYRLQTKGADGSSEDWELQVSSVTALAQVGWTQKTLKIGDQVTVSGQVGRDGAKKLYLRSAVRADGTKLLTGRGADTKAADPNQVHTTRTSYGYGNGRNNYPIDISGAWRNNYHWHVTVDDLEPKPTPFTAEGKRVFESKDHWQDTALRCLPLGLPRLIGSPYNMEVVDSGDHYLFIYVEHNTPRRVWMDGRKPTDDTPDTSLGFSVGRWEGSSLTIETTHLMPAWLDGSGLPMKGEGTRVVERYDFAADKLSMERTITIYDPYYAQPLVRKRGSARDDNVDVSEQSACDPDSYYRDLRELGRLDKHLDER
ncbi:MAG TPA: DUF6152 family protein [Gammaproteobacteria bacterium]|nr:DUF6152 family protein [Gammaproteobacteria bacterium]